MKSRSPARRFAWKRLAVIVLGGLAGIGAGLAGVYGIERMLRNDAPASCFATANRAQRLEPLARGEIAGLAMAKSPISADALSFRDGTGRERKLSEWSGRIVLLNLWATWCVPCRQEMPALDALQKALGSGDFEVVAVNIDTRDLEKPKTWLKDAGIAQLAYYADPNAKIFQDLKAAGRAVGMPTSLVIDRNGCEIATLSGPAEWASPDAIGFVNAALKDGQAAVTR